MLRRVSVITSIILAIGICLPIIIADVCIAGDANRSSDSVLIEVRRGEAAQWTATIHLSNGKNVSALTLPLRWDSGDEAFRLDSASYAGTRVAYFAVKTFFPDTMANTILLGLISDLGRGLPPLEPGRGPIVKLHFTAPHDSAAYLTMDTTFIRPHNILQMVTPDIRALYPEFEVIQIPDNSTP